MSEGLQGALIINADDWGRDQLTTTRIFECAADGAVSSVSAMVFMADSERAATVAREHRIDAGLHLNLTTPFSGIRVPTRLAESHGQIASFLRSHRYAQLLYNPMLDRAFDYVVRTQSDEYCRIYGREPDRYDGHHHMHLAVNVLVRGLIPSGKIVRRNFCFSSGEKNGVNRIYRRLSDRWLARRYRLTDYFFALAPMQTDRLDFIRGLAATATVEVETHPVNPEEYAFLRNAPRRLATVAISPGFCLPRTQAARHAKTAPPHDLTVRWRP